MGISWRLWFRLALVVAILVVLWVRIAALHRSRPSANKPIADLAASSPLNQPGGGFAPAEAYEVYSGLYQEPTQDPLVFVQDSVTDIPQVNGSCLRPSTATEHEMADAFVAANQQSHRWEEKFSIPASYRLLPRSEVAQVRPCMKPHGSDASGCENYKGLRYLRYLGVPGFDQSHTHALVSVIKSCGGFCGSGGIFMVEKTDGKWQRSAPSDFTSNCSWMY